MEPGPEQARGVSDAELNVGVPSNPTATPNSSFAARWDINASHSIHRRDKLGFADNFVSILENSAIQLAVFSGIPGQGRTGQFNRLLIFQETAPNVLDVLGFQKIEAKPEADHARDDRQGFGRPPDILGRLPLFPAVLLLPEPGEPEGLSGRMLPEVDAPAQPVVILLAPAKAFDPVDDPERGRQPRAVVAHHRPVVIIKAEHDFAGIPAG